MITQEELKVLLHYDENTGIFSRKYDSQNQFACDPAGCTDVQSGYVKITIKRSSYKAHRLAWLYVYGEWPKDVIDHINGDKADNRIVNLRDVSVRANCQNMRKHREGKIPGVRLDSRTNRYIVRVNKGKDGYKDVGTFATIEEAKTAYIHACDNYDSIVTRKEQRLADGVPYGINFCNTSKKWRVSIAIPPKKQTTYGRYNTLEEAKARLQEVLATQVPKGES